MKADRLKFSFNILLQVPPQYSPDGISVVICFAAAVGDFHFFIPCEVQVSSAEQDGNVAWTKAGICCSFHFSDPILRGTGSGEL